MPGTLARTISSSRVGDRIADPVIEAAALERVVDFAGAVGGDDDDRRMLGLDRAELGDGDLEVGQHFEQERLERLVAAVELVDQQHRRAGGIRLERLQQRPLDQEALGEHVVLDALAVVLALRLGGADRDHLRGVVPLVDRGRDVEALVALQPDQPAAERLRQHLGDLGLADAGLAFEEDRPAHLQRQEQHGRERAVGEIVGRRRAASAWRRSRPGTAGGFSVSWLATLLPSRPALSQPSASCRSCVPKTRMPGTRPGMTPSSDARPKIGRRQRNRYAAASARRASTPTRWARYSALPWMSVFMPSAGMVMPSIDFAREALLQRLLEALHAEHAVGAGAGHRHADVGAALGHEHADQREARGRVLELLVGRLLGEREAAPW